MQLIDLGDEVHPAVLEAFQSFCAVAKTWSRVATGTHPNDRERYAKFIALAHVHDCAVDSERLQQSLESAAHADVDREGNAEIAAKLVRDYEVGRAVLFEYDQLVAAAVARQIR